MGLHVVYYKDGTYRNKKNSKDRYNVKSLGDVIREGELLKVTCNDLGLDYTKETLIKIAFQGALTSNIKYDTDFSLIEMLTEVLDEDLLYEIIENGNMEQYIIKKRRGLIR